MSSETVNHVVIVGGGTAGWLTAGVIAADHRAASEDGLRVTVIESPRIPILGVGEGTWPSLRDTLRRIGVSETEFIRRCDASFKQGSKFIGWAGEGAEDFYFHPFEAPPSEDQTDWRALWRDGPTRNPFAATVGCQSALCLSGKAPKQIVTPEFAGVANYAYHLDAPAFAGMLRDHCTQKLGVRLVVDDVVAVVRGEGGDVASLETSESGAIEGDLFVDCTGTNALLIDGAMGAPLTDVSNVLFNDRALAIQVSCRSASEPIASQTNGTAMSAGWIWDIALRTRRGVGYVYSSAHAGESEARSELTGYLERTAPNCGLSGEDARLIRFRSAYRETAWVKNVVAVGMSQSFVEPLEASAIVMIELSAAMISDILPPQRQAMTAAAARFNRRFSYRWGRIVDFLKLHYVVSRRPERLWADHRDRSTWPERLRVLMDQWRLVPPSREDFTDALEIFPAASYAYVLYGMGFETSPSSRRGRKQTPETLARIRQEIEARKSRLLQGLPSNRELLDHIMTRGLTAV